MCNETATFFGKYLPKSVRKSLSPDAFNQESEVHIGRLLYLSQELDFAAKLGQLVPKHGQFDVSVQDAALHQVQPPDEEINAMTHACVVTKQSHNIRLLYFA